MDDLGIKEGRVVYSLKGRDKGRYYIIVKAIDERFVLITDGEIRKLSNPKKKNISHLKLTYDCLDNIGNKLIKKTKVFDKEIVSALRAYNKKD